MVYPSMKFTSEFAEVKIFQGVMHQAPTTAQMNWPRRILTYLGKSAERSFATEMELADMLMPMEAIKNARAQKNAAALPPCGRLSEG